MVAALQSILDAEPRGADSGRPKQQKFGILDSPTLEAEDVARGSGVFGRALIFIDLDKFKDLNTRLTNEVVDKLILPPLHRALVACAESIGFAYGKGGDEVTVLLPNATEEIAVAVARAIHDRIGSLTFEGDAADVRLASTIGVAWQRAGEDGAELATQANRAEVFAKMQGRNCIATWRDDAGRVVHRGNT
jgi:diguanylate cyclase (GGDEF)-like protein